MTKRTPTTRFGDAPRSPGSQPGRGAPLPLATMPLMTEETAALDPGATRVDNPMAPNVPGANYRDNKPTAIQAAVNPNVVVAAPNTMPRDRRPSQVGGPAPEIGLTQHHLPDEVPDPRLELVIDPDGERSAAFRVLRHHLLEVGRPQCVVVSSPVAGDGKTTTAANLALALAECGRAKVLLVETHVRRPQLASMFKFVPPWCFAEQLAAHRHQPMLPWSLIEIPSLWLHVGAINPRIEKTQLLDGPAFAIAMERLRLAGYDHIVVDGPPVLGSADANLMSDAADAVILSLRSRRSTTRDLKKAVDQLGASKVVGTVLVQ